MAYAKIENNAVTQYPYTFNQLKKDTGVSFPDNFLSLPERMAEFGFVEVGPAAPIDYDSATQRIEHGDPILVDGAWRLSSQVVDLNAEQLQVKAEETRAKAKKERAAAVAAITVTTTAGNTFDGDEDSQNRMTRAIMGAVDDTETVPWTLADNTIVNVNRVELAEALRLAGSAQAAIWSLI